ncbi:hypothetical protein Taro_010295 [Colocasia esculenta]|uniref:Uncharacterized protein n=1 Tax=Colocasia esculenta TaxID=4460 RepID=A0A843U366_COLES|nr:hypothetical protein [Colocasia esculenta]
MRGCTAAGDLNVTHYSRPLPWIGLYVAAASFLCGAAMGFDAYSGFRRRQLWFPSRFFSINATTLTLLGIATKLTVDLNTSMPRAADQLTKLSGTILICTVTANFMPSLGDMDDSEIVSNVVALGILVITVVVNIGIQMGTGVIYVFLPEHAIIMLLMMVALVLMVSSALPIATTKHLLEEQYLARHREAESADGGGPGGDIEESEQKPIPLDKLKVHVKRCWLMAHTCNPQYVLGRSATCTASGAFCLVGALVLSQALMRALLGCGPGVRFCNGAFDYKWSTTLVLATQVAAVIVGTVAPVYRWFYAVNLRRMDREDWTLADEFTVEEYWVERLKGLKGAPLPIEIGSSWLKRAAHDLNSYFMAILIRLQEGIVLASKFVRLLCVVPVHWLQKGGTGSSPSLQVDNDLKGYVLRLEGEEDLVRLITKSKLKDDTERWMQEGRKKQPKALLQLILNHSTRLEGFKHAGAFDSSGKEPLLPKEPPNCWSLPLVTLAAVAAPLPGVQQNEVDLLLRGVKEGLKFVKLVEKNLDEMGLVNMRGAAESVWVGLELNKKWLDRDLRNLAPRSEGDGRGKKVAEAAQSIAEQEVVDSVIKLGISKHVLSWPERTMAANCMYRVCATIIQDYEEGRHPTDAHLFDWLRTTISDILGSCLTNLSRTLYMESFSHKVEEREKCVRDAALALGEAEQILEIPDHVASRFPSRTQYLDDWKNRGRDV